MSYGSFNPVVTTTPTGSQQDAEIAKVIIATTDDVNGTYFIGDQLTKVITFLNGVPTITYLKDNGLSLSASQINLADFQVPTSAGIIEYAEVECFTIANTPSTLAEMLTAVGKSVPVGAQYCEVTIPYDLSNNVANSVIVSKNDTPSNSVGVPQSEGFSLTGSSISTAKILGLPAISGLEVRLVLNFYNQNPN